jgi:nucleoside-diphosphate-sugar epimerase
MKKNILVAGATGNLGGRISNELIQMGASVRAIVRPSSDTVKVETLRNTGIEVQVIDLDSVDEIAKACDGVDCIVSALAGLADVIIDLQTRILDGALKAGVPRFIPSDFCTDYNFLKPGHNRNFDLRRTFKDYLDSTSIRASSIFNGAFSDILRYNTPVLNLKDQSIAYWGDKHDWKLDFTTMDNTAAFTAAVAMDNDAPRDLQIASFQISPDELRAHVQEITGRSFRISALSSMEDFARYIEKQRADDPAGEQELYAKWQQSQYMFSMFSTQHNHLANSRYQGIKWITARAYLETFIR